MAKDLIEQFQAFYSDFAQVDLSLMADLYEPQITFVDPVCTVEGLPALSRYFERSRANVSYCRFEFVSRTAQLDCAFFQWRMHYAHPRIDSGRAQILRGCSALKMDGKIIYHEDYYDLGAMLYEHLPILGWVTRKIKHRLVEI
jgi:SnoaL-like domain